MRNGKWVTVANSIPGAHVIGGNRSLGIYQRAGKDAQGNTTPEHVAIVRTDGTNLTRLSDDGNRVENVDLSLAQCQDLQPLDDLSHVPRPGSHRPA